MGDVDKVKLRFGEITMLQTSPHDQTLKLDQILITFDRLRLPIVAREFVGNDHGKRSLNGSAIHCAPMPLVATPRTFDEYDP